MATDEAGDLAMSNTDSHKAKLSGHYIEATDPLEFSQ